jgi:hypothetical protein
MCYKNCILSWKCSVLTIRSATYQELFSCRSPTIKLSYLSSLTSNLVPLYSGDHDALVPFLGTQSWVRSLNFPVLDEWRAWHLDGQSAG